MPVKVIADEHIPLRILESMRQAGLAVISIFQDHRGLQDHDIFAICLRQPSILLTYDKAFAAWAVAAQGKQVGVILLRYDRSELDKIAQTLLDLSQTPEGLLDIYSVISVSKTRQRRIH